MDAEKLSEAVSQSELAPPSGPATWCVEHCAPPQCRDQCGLDIVDELLALPEAVSGDEADHLLDLRHLLTARRDAETTLRLFCDLRRRLEQRHYLAFYRMRRWLENHIAAEVCASPDSEVHTIRLHLNLYFVEAIRRVALCTVLGQGVSLEKPRLNFVFLPSLKPAHGRVAASPSLLTAGT